MNTHGEIKTVLSKIHLDQCVEGQYLLNIISLGPALFSDDDSI